MLLNSRAPSLFHLQPNTATRACQAVNSYPCLHDFLVNCIAPRAGTMPAKPVHSWSKRHSGVDSSSRTGLLDTLKRRPSKLVTTAADGKQNRSSTSVAQYDTALASAVSNFHVAANDMLYSPESINTLCSKSSFVDKPFPNRPRSASVPSLVELPAELPESTLLQGQGYPLYHDPIHATKSVQALQNESHHPKMQVACEKATTLEIPKPAIPTLTHARSVPHLNSRYSLAKKTRPSKIPVPSTAAQSGFQGLQRNHSLADTTLQRRPESTPIKSLLTVTKNDLVKRDGRNSDQGPEKRHDYIEAVSLFPFFLYTHVSEICKSLARRSIFGTLMYNER